METGIKLLAVALLLGGSTGLHAAAAPLAVVAAENFYGDVAKQIGGDDVAVASIMSKPDEDPHLFEASRSTAKAVGRRENCHRQRRGDYDPWMEKLLDASKAPGRVEIVVADLVHKKSGDNPLSLVRARDHAGARRPTGRRTFRPRPGAQGRLRQR